VVHNTGGTEPLGQTVQALPISALQTRSLIGSLLVEHGHRSNVGVANPHDEPLQVRFSSPNGLNAKVFTVAPHSFVQMNARDAAVSLEADSRVVLVSASKPVYAYGSLIRGGDGDPQFILPVEVRPSSSFVVEPACGTAAARLTLSLESPAPGWIVVLKDGVESDIETPRLMARHGFTPRYVYSAALEGFGSELTPQQVAALRCEATVSFIEQNQWMSVRGTSTMTAASRH
jgi:hypothetical protein